MSFWKWPGHWQPHQVDNLTAHLDVVPTLCKLAGVDIPKELQSKLEGFNLLPLLESTEPISWHDDRMLFQHVGRWPSGLAASHRHAMCGVRQGNYLLLRSTPCNDPECEKYQSQCTTLRSVRKGMKSTTYTQGDAQFHWGVSAADRWSLFDSKKDPGCQSDLAASNPKLVSTLAAAYDKWWDELYPVMIENGGDKGDPNASAHAASRARQHAAINSAKDKMQKEKPPKQSPKSTTDDEANLFRRMDTNADQKVTRDEYVGLFVSSFPTKDSDGDGELTAAEFAFPSSFNQADTDGSGKLSAAEFKELYIGHFKHHDKNQDGVLSEKELKR